MGWLGKLNTIFLALKLTGWLEKLSIKVDGLVGKTESHFFALKLIGWLGKLNAIFLALKLMGWLEKLNAIF